MIAETITNPPATVPGPVLLILLALFFGGISYLALTDARRGLDDFERREQYRRDQQAQDSWEHTKQAMAPRNYR